MAIFGKKDEREQPGRKGVDAEAVMTDEERAKSLADKFEQYKDETLVLRIEKLRNMEDDFGVQVYKGSIKEPHELDDRMDMVGEKYGGILKANVRSKEKGFLIVRHYVREYPERDGDTPQPVMLQSGVSGASGADRILEIMLQQAKEREERERQRDDREREREDRRREELRLEREEREKMNQATLKALSEQSQKAHEATQSAVLEMNKMVLQMMMNKKEPDVLALAGQLKTLIGDGGNSVNKFMEMFNLAKDVLEGRAPQGDKGLLEVVGDVAKKVLEGLSAQQQGGTPGKAPQGAGANSKPGEDAKAMMVKANNKIEAFISKHRGELLQAITTTVLSEYEKGRGLIQVFYTDPEFKMVPIQELRAELMALTPERVMEFIPGAKGSEDHLKAILQQSMNYVEEEMKSSATPETPGTPEEKDDD